MCVPSGRFVTSPGQPVGWPKLFGKIPSDEANFFMKSHVLGTVKTIETIFLIEI